MENTNSKNTYFKTSTASQRRFLFEKWEELGSVTKACRLAKVSRKTFYLWKPRFIKDGYPGLENPLSHAPHNPRKTSEKIRDAVIKMKKENVDWGRQRIADELMKSNDWKPLVSASTSTNTC